MSELGQHLKEVREQKQISLDDLQRTTKIQKRYLLAIEEGRFETLPGLFYARAFVKTYAEAIGLDSEPLFAEYRDELPNPRRESVELPSRTERSKAPPITNKKKRVTSFMPALIWVALVLIAVVGIWVGAKWLSQQSGEVVTPDETSENLDADLGTISEVDDPESEPNTGETDEEEESAEEVTEEEPVEEAKLVFIESRGNTSYFEIEGTDQFKAFVEISDRSYVDIKNGLGNTFYSGEPTTGVEISEDFSAEEEIIFNFGASQNVQLTINEEPVEFPLNNAHQKINVRFSEE
ncbi:helix-turn-helix domain-containing protein [Bacillus solitudinis]|uniref:helix-turn-helix domain-containing protein n=1 Tax=Bacillus solitudinis TaxID=2014074 RepID=UPI000C23A7C1|nr:helix-turn-helix domain-containing protein [Bacillus solitudinis]